MTSNEAEGDQNDDSTLADRLEKIEKLEEEILNKAQQYLASSSAIVTCDFFVLGAINRTVSQATGFRHLIEQRNFLCAAAILRMQLDTAMRINGLKFMPNADACCRAILGGERFNRFKDASGEKLTDGYLATKLNEEFPWIKKVYHQTSDFIHLSSRHHFNAITRMDEKTRMIYLSISGSDPQGPDSDYFEIVTAFFEATKLAGLLCLAYFASRAWATTQPRPAEPGSIDV